MKLVTFEIRSQAGSGERIGAFTDRGVVDLAAAYVFLMETGRGLLLSEEESFEVVPRDMIDFMSGGVALKALADQALQHVLEAAKKQMAITYRAQPVIYSREEVKLLSPVVRPNSIRDTISFEQHLKNSLARIGLKDLPKAWYEIPGVYRGNHNSVIGTDDPVIAPSYTRELDYELEFGIYIGKRGKNIPKDKAHEYIYGYTIFNDISARDVQGKEMTLSLGPSKSKNFDNGNVIGPWLVTPDEIGDPYNLRMLARVNGEQWSEGNTGTMHWRFPEIVEYISREETLYPGDFIGSGTVGFGCGLELGGKYLKPGDLIELEVEKLGILANRVIGAA
jgi:2-keto-4-pentenoate hydratase/2-oxohepta-3-ene-1,7-dioic acid hydratase in catechol pathway